TRILPPSAIPFSCAMLTILSWICLMTSGPRAKPPAAHGLGIRHFGEAYAGEVAVDQVGTHLTLEHVITPIAHVFQDQQTQHYFRRETAPAACAAQVMALAQSFIHGRQDLFIAEHLVGMIHPLFAKALDLVSDQFVAEVELCAPQFNHVAFSRALMRLHRDAGTDG